MQHSPGPHRLPVAPLLKQVELRIVAGNSRDWTRPPSLQHYCQATGLSYRMIERWRERPDSTITWWKADEIACKIGLHPIIVWPNYYEDEEVA